MVPKDPLMASASRARPTSITKASIDYARVKTASHGIEFGSKLGSLSRLLVLRPPGGMKGGREQSKWAEVDWTDAAGAKK